MQFPVAHAPGSRNVAGYLADGVAGWSKNGFELEYIPQVTAQEFVELREQQRGRIAVLDVRESGELSGGVIERSGHIRRTEGKEGELDRDRLLVVYCKGGYRSSIAANVLQRVWGCPIKVIGR